MKTKKFINSHKVRPIVWVS